jgi:putative membrane protein
MVLKNKKISLLIVLEICFILALLFTIGKTFMDQRWDKFFASIFIIPLSFITFFIYNLTEKRNIKIPYGTYIASHLFIIATLYLGPILGLYEKYPWWDSLLHFLSGPLLVVIAFNILSVLEYKDLIKSSKTPIFFMLSSFIFSLAVHSIWELYEFLVDLLFGTKMTNFDIMDTMLDTLLNFISSVISAFIIKSIKEQSRARI